MRSYKDGCGSGVDRPVGFRSPGDLVLLATIVSVFLFAMFPLLGRPFAVGHDGLNGAVFSMSASNMLRFGLCQTKAAPTRVYWDEGPPAEKSFYTSKPYGHPLLLAGAYALFGMSERVGRSLSLTFSLALMLLFYFVGQSMGAPLGGLVMAGAAASLPMMHEFAPMMIGQIPSLPFVLMLYFFYWRYLKTGRMTPGVAAGICGAFFGGGMLDWHVFFHLPAILLHCAWTGRGKPASVRRFWGLLLVAASLPLLLFLAHTYWLDGFPYLLGKIEQRTGFAPAVNFTWPQFFSREWDYLRSMYRVPTVLVALVALAVPAAGPAREMQGLAQVAAAAGALETLLVNEANYIHIYYSFVWIIPVCLALGSAAETLARGFGELMAGILASVLLAVLFASSFNQARQSAENSWRHSEPLIRLAQNLSRRLLPGEKVIFYMKGTQFGPQIRYYLKARALYPKSVFEVEAHLHRCRECRFIVVDAERAPMPNARALQEALKRRYPYELAYGFYLLTLPRSQKSAPS